MSCVPAGLKQQSYTTGLVPGACPSDAFTCERTTHIRLTPKKILLTLLRTSGSRLNIYKYTLHARGRDARYGLHNHVLIDSVAISGRASNQCVSSFEKSRSAPANSTRTASCQATDDPTDISLLDDPFPPRSPVASAAPEPTTSRRLLWGDCAIAIGGGKPFSKFRLRCA